MKQSVECKLYIVHGISATNAQLCKAGEVDSGLCCSFDAAGGASAEANNAAVARLAGLDPTDVIMGEWSNSIMRPCHYVAADKANRCLVLAVRWIVQAVQHLAADEAIHCILLAICSSNDYRLHCCWRQTACRFIAKTLLLSPDMQMVTQNAVSAPVGIIVGASYTQRQPKMV